MEIFSMTQTLSIIARLHLLLRAKNVCNYCKKRNNETNSPYVWVKQCDKKFPGLVS